MRWSRRAQSVLLCRRGARLSANVSRTTTKKYNSDQITRKKNSDLLTADVEVSCGTSSNRSRPRGTVDGRRECQRAWAPSVDVSLAHHGRGSVRAPLNDRAGLIGHVRSLREVAPLWGSSLRRRTHERFVGQSLIRKTG